MRIRARVPAILGSIALLILICGFALWSGADSGRPCHCDRRAGL